MKYKRTSKINYTDTIGSIIVGTITVSILIGYIIIRLGLWNIKS